MAVLDRFGDEEFLRELWLRARGQLPAEIQGVEELKASGLAQPELGKRLHKLRGLIANFLEGGEAINRLRHCEELCREQGDRLADEPWSAFRESLRAEAGQLESWLTERGFPCA
jgi:hypothetical protein